ncbi:MAG: SH3 domain-containing protein [Anaerolineae bacterium]|nr:SH3 domain-containing protein [Anaerolineae bacterium]
MRRTKRETELLSSEKRLIAAALCLIGVLTYSVGVAWRTSMDNSEQPRALAQAPTAALSLPTPLPTDTPVVPLQAPTKPFGPVHETATPTPTVFSLPTVLPSDTPRPTEAPPLEIEAVVNAEAGLKLRTGPSTDFPHTAVLLKGARVVVFRRTADSTWARVRVPATSGEGWVFAQYLSMNGDFARVAVASAAESAPLPTPQPETGQVAVERPPAQACVSVVGDSIAYGEVIFELSGVGFIHVKMAPFSFYMAQQLKLRNIDQPVTDRSYPGIGITSPRHKSYYDLPTYRDLLRDRCRFTVVLPWVNDLSSGIDPVEAAPLHAENLADMARRLIENNPDGRILFVNYYYGAPAPFTLGMAGGFRPEAIRLFNEAMDRACREGALSRMRQVTCVDVENAFRGLGTTYVVQGMRRAEIEAVKTAPLSPEHQKMFDYYNSINPNGVMQGDGVHLSSLGKRVLASYIADIMLRLPDLPSE